MLPPPMLREVTQDNHASPTPQSEDTEHGAALRSMPRLNTPAWEIQRDVFFYAAMHTLPYIEMTSDEISLFSEWQLAQPDKLRAILQLEEAQHTPAGPEGYWASTESLGRECAPLSRPHRHDEIILEWMSTVWTDEDHYGYLTAVSSGPYQGLFSIYWNNKHIVNTLDMPFHSAETAQAWIRDTLRTHPRLTG